MASITERKKTDGTCSYLITVSLGRDEKNKKIKKTTTFTAKSKAPPKARKEAEAYACEFEKKVLAGDLPVDDSITFAAFAGILHQAGSTITISVGLNNRGTLSGLLRPALTTIRPS